MSATARRRPALEHRARIRWRSAALVVLGGLVIVISSACGSDRSDRSDRLPPAKTQRSPLGMVATGSEPATAAGVEMLERGGNAADAAAAAALALMVTDPANASLGGRVQLLVHEADGTVVAIDGATQVPRQPLPARIDDEVDRSGFETAPVPGSLAAIDRLVRDHGRLPLATVLGPAIRLAHEGFIVPPRLADSWSRVAEALARDPGASRHYLTADGAPYAAGERFRNPALAGMLQVVADSGASVFYDGYVAEQLTAEIAAGGGFTTLDDLVGYQALDGEVVHAEYRGHDVLAAGGRGWGDTLVQLLNMLAEFPIGPGEPTADELEVLARIIAQAMADRPQEIGSLAPKPAGWPLDSLSSKSFAQRRASQIRADIADGRSPAHADAPRDHDTSHLSVMDAEGNAVALTTSIGPSFGARVASQSWGMLFGHSYQMRRQPEPGARDLTEMTPTIVRRERPTLVLGAAGSERIPTAIMQVLSHVVDRGRTLEQAMSAPRIFAVEDQLRVHDWLAPELVAELAERGFEVRPVALGESPHLGLVHAVAFDPDEGVFVGVADAGDSGSAGAPAVLERR